MHRTLIAQAALSAALAITAITAAAQSDVRFAEPASDATNYLGDRIDHPSRLTVRKVKLGTNEASAEACLPGRSTLNGTGKVSVKLGEGDQAQEVPHDLFTVRGVADAGVFISAEERAKLAAACNGNVVAVGDTVAIPSKLLADSPPDRYGWTFGTLVVPYKYQVKGDRSLSGGATLGGYVGYRNTIRGISTQLIVFGGATKVDVPRTVDGKSVVESMAGLSYGVGLLGSIKNSFKLGFVIGADHVGKSVDYVNDGKPWISFSLGYDFFN